MRTTSLIAYHRIRNDGLLAGMQLKVYQTVADNPNATANEISDLIRHSIAFPPQMNSISPRFAELQKLLVIAPSGEKICSISGKKALTWQITDKLPMRLQKSKPPGKTALLRRENKELREEILRLESIIEKLQQKLLRWGRPTAERTAKRFAGQPTLFGENKI